MSKSLLIKIVLTGVFALPFIPLLVSSSMFFPFITGKNFAFRIIIEIIAVVWAILAIREPEYRPKKTTTLITFGAFLGIIALADILGENPYRSFWSNYERMEGLVTHLHLFTYFLIASSILTTERLWQKFFFTSFGVNLVLAFFAFFQLSGALSINQGGVRIDATLGNATYFAVYLLFHIFLTVFFFVRQRFSTRDLALFSSLGIVLGSFLVVPGYVPAGTKFLIVIVGFCVAGVAFALSHFKEGKWLLSLIVFLNLVLLYQTETRGAILGLIAGILISFGLFVLTHWQDSRVRKYALGGLLSVVVLISLFIVFKESALIQNSSTLKRFADISISETTTTSRFMVWGMSLRGFKERPILGWGQENFIVVFSKYYNPKMYAQEPWFDRSHNVFLDWMIAGGTLGILSYLALFGSALFVLWRRTTLLSLAEKNILTGLLGAYFVQNLFVFDNLVSYFLFFSVVAFITWASTSDTNKGGQTVTRGNISSYHQTISNALVPVLVVLLVVGMYFLNVKPIIASRTLIQAISPKDNLIDNYNAFEKVFSLNTFGGGEAREQLVQAGSRIAQLPPERASPELKQRFFTMIQEQMSAQIKQAPTDLRYELYYGSILNSFGFYDVAIEHLKRGLELSTTKQPVYFEIASSYLNKGDPTQAVNYFKQARDLEPAYPDGQTLYATGLVYAGRLAEAEKVLKDFFGTDLVTDNRLINAYDSRGLYGKIIQIRKKQLEENPADSQVRLSLAATYLKMGNRTQAIAELEEIIRRDPSFKTQGEYFINEIRAGRNP